MAALLCRTAQYFFTIRSNVFGGAPGVLSRATHEASSTQMTAFSSMACYWCSMNPATDLAMAQSSDAEVTWTSLNDVVVA
jgi:hypothetical protein